LNQYVRLGAGNVARTGERRGAYRVLVRKPEGKNHFGRPRRRCNDNIKMDIQEMRCGGMGWIDLALIGTIVNAVMKLRVP